jgi:hypothetical protein
MPKIDAVRSRRRIVRGPALVPGGGRDGGFSHPPRAGACVVGASSAKLLAWANKHGIPVFGHRRFLTVLVCGFGGAQQARRWRRATAELRRTKDAIERGEESGMIYCGGRDLLVFGEEVRFRWGVPDEFMPRVAGVYPSLAGPLPEAAGERPQTAPPPDAPAPARPLPPRGTILHPDISSLSQIVNISI